MAELGRERYKSRPISKRLILIATTLLTLGAGILAVPTVSRIFGPAKQAENARVISPISDKSSHVPKQKKLRRVWCSYSPAHEAIIAYMEKRGESTKGGELGSGFLFPASKAFEGTKPLAVACHTNGAIWWVSETTAYSGRLVPIGDDCCSVNEVTEVSYTKLSEYLTPETRVIAASIWWPLSEQAPYIATITNTGYFQAFRAPLNEPTPSEHFVVELGSKRWPQNITGAVLGMLSKYEFALIPLGDKDSKDGGVTYFYYFKCPEGSYNDPGDMTISRTDLIKGWRSDLKTVFASSPIIYEEDEGGWISTIRGITTHGEIVSLNVLIKPRDVLEKERKDAGSKKATPAP